ncbi:MAG TPA: BON domain-containing protein [Usitatibacter sp.]|nr:BON domain-containing protein [Usitatibacter sp.]
MGSQFLIRGALVTHVIAATLALSLAACDRDTQARTDQKVNNALDRTQKSLAEAGQKTQQKLAEVGEKVQPKIEEASASLQPKLERAGERISEAAARTGEKISEATQRTGDKVSSTVSAGERTAVSGISPETRATLSDTAITASIKADYLKDPDLSVLKIDVDTTGGVVTLNGLADNEAARKRAEQMASSIKGVKEVRNHLTVKRG